MSQYGDMCYICYIGYTLLKCTTCHSYNKAFYMQPHRLSATLKLYKKIQIPG